MQELIVIEKLELVPFFTKGDLVDELLEQIKTEALAHVPDVSTQKGRDAIKANITKLTKSKTYLKEKGDDLAAEYKAIPKQIDANRRKVKEFLNEVQTTARQKLTEWEEEKRAEEDAIQQKFDQLQELSCDIDVAGELRGVGSLKESLEFLHGLVVGEEWGKMELPAIKEQRKGIETLTGLIEKAMKRDADAAELERLRQETAEREQKEHEARIAKEATEAAELAAAEEIEKAKQEKQQAEHSAAMAKENAKAQEQARLESIRQADVNAKAAVKAAALRAKADAAQAVEDERQRVEQARLDEEAAQAKRESNKRHMGSVNRKALADLMKVPGVTEDIGKAIITAIAKKEITSIQINY